MDINFTCTIGLMTVAVGTLSALLLLRQSKPDANRRLPGSVFRGAAEKPAFPVQVEDGDITLGNSLSCLLIQLDVAKKYSKKSPEIAFNALEEAESIAQQTLWQLRLRRRSNESERDRSASELSKAAF